MTIAPEFRLWAGNAQSDGLTFLHRRLAQTDIYLRHQPATGSEPDGGDVPGYRKFPEQWDRRPAMLAPVLVYRTQASGVEIPLRLPALASMCILFRAAEPQPHLTAANLEEVRELTEHEVRGIVTRNGEASATAVKNGQSKTARLTVTGLPEPLAVSGTWRMSLEGYRFPQLKKEVLQLQSWTEDPQTEHFSGTGRYEIDFQVPSEYVNAGLEAVLDVGKVGDVAEVTLNGHAVGVAWMQPHQLDVTEALRSGANHLELQVTNALINYVSGLSKLPDVPEELAPHYGKTTDIYKRGALYWEQFEKNFHPLPPSGLIGPVRIIPRRKVTLEL